MKKYIFLGMLALTGSLNDLFAQGICLKPTAMSEQQLKMVTGKWKGSYSLPGNQQEIELTLSVNKAGEMMCAITNPPLPGKETGAQYFFCPAGEFHVMKSIGTSAYTFQGVPANGQLNGQLSLFTAAKRNATGDFKLNKVD